MKPIKLGSKVECVVTGFKGIITGKCEYINGCIQYLISPKVKKSNERNKSVWIDAEQLKVIKGGVSIKKTMGGPRDNYPSASRRD